MPEPAPHQSTAVDAGFRFGASGAGRILIASALEPLAPHLFSTRHLEFRDQAARDYERVAEYFGVLEADVLRVKQVHGRVVVVVRPGDAWVEAPEADAIVSLDPTRVISVRVADCVPILLADRHGLVVAVVHAGWRGTAARVAEATVETLITLGVAADDVVAAIGPAIGPCCYQVDATVRRAFGTAQSAAWFSNDGSDHWRLDLAAANRDQLVASGLSPQHIALAGRCTSGGVDDWFSFRRDGPSTGRMVGAIRLRDNARRAALTDRQAP